MALRMISLSTVPVSQYRCSDTRSDLRRQKSTVISGDLRKFDELWNSRHPFRLVLRVLNGPKEWLLLAAIVAGTITNQNSRSHDLSRMRPEELIAFVKARLGSVKAPKQVEVWADLPRSKVGKVLKKEVRASLLQKLQSP